MIDSKELMLGNWVRTMNGYEQVVDVMCNSLNCTKGSFTLDYVTPVSLTLEILEKAGFTENSAYGWEDKDGMVELHFKGNSIMYRNIKIDSVHKLQNLFYSLTQTELNIQL